MKRLCAVVLLGTVVACGGGSSSPTAPPPVPTPVPVTYNGKYTGTSMTFTLAGGVFLATASTTITQAGSNLSFGSMTVTSPFQASYGMGAAVLNGNTFDGTAQYVSGGCGIITNHYKGYFDSSGNIMNMTMTLTGTGDCGAVDLRGEMRR